MLQCMAIGTVPTKYMGTKQTGHWVAAPDSRCRPVFSDDNGYLRASDLRHGNHSIGIWCCAGCNITLRQVELWDISAKRRTITGATLPR